MRDEYDSKYDGDGNGDDYPEPEPECVICGVAVRKGQRYCGTSCEQYDDGEPCTWEAKEEDAMTKYESMCQKLGYRPEVGFVKLTSRGTIGFTLGKPEEIRTLYHRVLDAGMRPSKNLCKAYERVKL